MSSCDPLVQLLTQDAVSIGDGGGSHPEGLAGFRNQVNPDKLERATRRWAATDHGEPLVRAF